MTVIRGPPQFTRRLNKYHPYKASVSLAWASEAEELAYQLRNLEIQLGNLTYQLKNLEIQRDRAMELVEMNEQQVRLLDYRVAMLEVCDSMWLYKIVCDRRIRIMIRVRVLL